MTTSTSGISSASSSAYLCARHPVTMTFFFFPPCSCSAFIAAAARMASTLSFLASSTNPQVFTMIASASSCSSMMSKPLAKRSPSMTSPSTVFFGHPRETMDTFARCFSSAEGAVSLPSDGGDMAARGALLLAAANERRRALAVDVATDAPDRAARLPRMDATDMTLGSRVSLEVWTAREASCPCHSCCTELPWSCFFLCRPFSHPKSKRPRRRLLRVRR